ncbi:hypothetical protein, partial [Paractinoplanes toevensis]|uniref:hypothetical protein n=1 Tax=Paractinoplanes toevensis TaxID=571911 RepID=UPI001BB42864
MDNSSREVTRVSGQVNSADLCTSYPSRDSALFRTDYAPLRVVGTDGRFIYATDTCGIRRVDPETGAVTTLPYGNYRTSTASVAIAGQYLYAVDNSDSGLQKIDLNSGSNDSLNNNHHLGAVAADSNFVWMVNTDHIFKIDRNTGAILKQWPVAVQGHAPTALLSVGNYLYASQ